MAGRIGTMALAGAAMLLQPWVAAATPEVPPTSQVESPIGPEEIQAALEQIRATILRAGDPVANWDVGGADPHSDVRARGADSHYLLTRGRDGTLVTILTDRPIEDLAPSAWQAVENYGSAETALERPQLDFMALSARYVMAVRSESHRVNDVDCSADVPHALLFEVPGAPPSTDDELAPDMFLAVIHAIDGVTICTRSDGNASEGYRTREFLPDGRPLLELYDPGQLSRIVPAAPIDQLIEPPPPRPGPTPTG